MRPGARFFIGALCLSLALLLALAGAVVVIWGHAAHGRPEMGARGTFLLRLFLPQVVVVTLLLVAALTVPAMRRCGFRWRGTIAVPLIAVAIVMALWFAPPLFVVPRALARLPRSLRPAADFVLAALLAAGGLALTLRRGRAAPPDEALRPSEW